MAEGRPDLQWLSNELRGLMDWLEEGAPRSDPARHGLHAPNRKTVALKLRELSAIRRRSFSAAGELFSDPAWEILIELYVDEQEARATSLCSLGLSSQVPQTTALRWLQRMTDAGLLQRRTDPHDRRRVLVALTPAGRDGIEHVLDSLGRGIGALN